MNAGGKDGREPLAPFIASFLGIPGIVLGDALNLHEGPCSCGDPGCAGVRVRLQFDAHVVGGALVWKRGLQPEDRRVALIGVDGKERRS